MIFDGFLTRLGTVMALGARHGKRGFPSEGQGIAIPVWGLAEPTETAPKTGVTSQDTNVTPFRPTTEANEPAKEQGKKQGGANG